MIWGFVNDDRLLVCEWAISLKGLNICQNTQVLSCFNHAVCQSRHCYESCSCKSNLLVYVKRNINKLK